MTTFRSEAQLGFDAAWRPLPPAETRAEETDRRAREYLERNPEVWKLIVRFTHELVARGRTHYGINAVIERIRWHHAVSSPETDFKVNNNYGPSFARMYEAAYPEHAGFFRTRRRRTE